MPTALIGVYVANGKPPCLNETTGVSGTGSGVAGALVCGVVSSGGAAANTALASSRGVNPPNEYDTITGLAGQPRSPRPPIC